jgi:hypothetical protein
MLQRFGLQRLMAMVPRRALRGLAILLAAALTLGGPVPAAPGSTYEATLTAKGAAADDAAAVRAIGSLWGPQALSAADDGPLAPPPEGAEAEAGLYSEVPAAWPRPTTLSRASTGTIDPSIGQFRAFYSRGPPLLA